MTKILTIFLGICGFIISFLVGDVLKRPDIIDTNGNFLLLFVAPLVFIAIMIVPLFITLVIDKGLFRKDYLLLSFFGYY